MSSNYLPVILQSLAYALPALIVFLVAVVIGMLRAKNHRQVSALAGIAFLLLIVNTLIGVLTSNIFMILQDQNFEISTIAMISLVIAILKTLFALIAWILLLIAIFGWRKQQQDTPQPVVDTSIMEEARNITGQLS